MKTGFANTGCLTFDMWNKQYQKMFKMVGKMVKVVHNYW